MTSAPRLRRRRPVLLGLLALAIAIVPLVLISRGILTADAGVLALAALLVLLFRSIDRHAPALLLVVGLAALVTTVGQQPLLRMGGGSRAAEDGEALARRWIGEGGSDLPVVIHLVFDELMSTGAIDPALPGGLETRQALVDLASRHRLRLYDSIYSRYFFSGVSIPDLMHTGYLGEEAPSTVRIDVRPAASAYFSDMARRGYRTAVFQSALIDFCAPESVALCEVFESFDPVASGRFDAGLAWRTARMADTLLRSISPAYTARIGRALLGRLTGVDSRGLEELGAGGRYDVHGFVPWFERVQAFVTGAPRGTHVFAHFLVPHAPYLLAEDCSLIDDVEDSGYYLATRRGVGSFEDARRRYYERYFRQVRCVARSVDALLTALDDHPASRDATVIIHGDHGSRISRSQLHQIVEPADLVDNYGTFFAVRAPGVEPGLDCEFTSLPQIFARILKGGAAPSDPPRPIMVPTGEDGQPRQATPMPRFGCAAGS